MDSALLIGISFNMLLKEEKGNEKEREKKDIWNIKNISLICQVTRIKSICFFFFYG